MGFANLSAFAAIRISPRQKKQSAQGWDVREHSSMLGMQSQGILKRWEENEENEHPSF